MYAIMMILGLHSNLTPPSHGNLQEPFATNIQFTCKISAECPMSISFMYAFISVVALLLNILVMWAVWPQVKSPFGVSAYVVSLLISSLMEAVTLGFGAAYSFGILTLGSITCSIIFAIPGLTRRVAAMLLVWMFILRYLAVAHPLKYRHFCSGCLCGLINLSVWLVSTGLSVFEKMLMKNNTNLCFPDYKVVPESAVIDLSFSFIFGLLPLILLGTFFTLITCALKTSSVSSVQWKRISSLLAVVVLGFGIFFIPISGIWGFLSIFLLQGRPRIELQTNFRLPYQLIFTLNSIGLVLPPFFYAYSSSEVKERLKGLLRNCKRTAHVVKDG